MRHCTEKSAVIDRLLLKLLNHSFTLDWVVLTKTKTALRKVVKLTHQIVNSQGLQLHPTKTYIGKIKHGFNFLAYYFDETKLLPAKETLRRFQERAVALYEQPPGPSSKHHPRRAVHQRDVSEYHVNEAAPCDTELRDFLISLFKRAAKNPDILKRMRRYVHG